MKEDVERRERAQAAVIENQAKRLEELETLYKVPCASRSSCSFITNLTCIRNLAPPDLPCT